MLGLGRRLRPILSILLVVALAGAARARRGGPPGVFVPDPGAAGVARLEGEAWLVEADGYSARLERLDDDARWRFLQEKANAPVDPFASSPGRPQAFFTFRVVLENRSGGSLVFDSQSCRLVARGGETRYPLDLPSIESWYGVLDQPMPPAYRTVLPAMFDGTLFLEPGRRVEGILVFRPPPPATRAFKVELALTTLDGQGGGLTAAYRRPKR